MKFKKTKRITALMLAAMMASGSVMSTAIAHAAETTVSTMAASSSETDSTNKVWVVDKEAYDEEVITGYRPYYECTGCGEKFYYDQYEASDGEEIAGQKNAAAAVSDHLFECESDNAGYTAKKEAIWETVHHDEVGHYEGISVDKSSLTIEAGETATLTATITPEDDSNVVTWMSSDTSVATVSDSGEVSGIAEGTATITATSPNGAYIECEVTITAPHVHVYDAPIYNWSDDYTACTATFTCVDGDDTKTVDCTVTSETKDATCNSVGQTIYTAKVTMNGETYTDVQTVIIDKNDNHQWDDGVVTTPATCTEAGIMTYTCTECGITKTEAIPATDHTYGKPTFNWSTDYKTCTATISCEKGDDEQTLDCTVSVKNTAATCTAAGSTVYTAKVTFNGKQYSDTKTVSTPATGHTYGEPIFNWADDLSTCTATFTCTAGDDTKTVKATVENRGGGVNITYVAIVTFNGKTYTSTATKVRFTDVPSTVYYYNAVDWAAENGITAGTFETTFSPDAFCTRSQVVTFLWNEAGKPEPASNENPFVDVSESVWYYKAVQWAVENGITAGTSETTFSPDMVCTRSQVVTFLWNEAGKPEPSVDAPAFSDVDASSWYGKAVQWAAENGVTAGTGNNMFSPNIACSRAEIVTLLYNYMGK